MTAEDDIVRQHQDLSSVHKLQHQQHVAPFQEPINIDTTFSVYPEGQTIGIADDPDRRVRSSRRLFLIGLFSLLFSIVFLWMPVVSFVFAATSIGASLYNVIYNYGHSIHRIKKYAIGSVAILFGYLALIIATIMIFVIFAAVLIIFGVNLSTAMFFFRNGGDDMELEGPLM